MTGIPFNLQAKKGVFQVSEISSSSNPCTASATSVSSFSSLLVVDNHKWKSKSCCYKDEIITSGCFEPTSVLDTRKSPSPPTSTSTLSSSLGAPSTTGSTDSAAGVAAVSDNPPSSKWPSTHGDTAAAAASEPGGNINRKDEWGSELQPIPTALEIIGGGTVGVGVGGGGEKCGGGGGGMEDWESMWPETAASSPSQEQSLLRWIMGDVEDPSSGLKQFLQGVGPSDHHQFEGNAGFGILDSGSGSAALEPLTHPSLLPPQLSNNVRPVVSNSLSIPLHNKGHNPNTSNPIFSPSSNSTAALTLPLPLNLPLPISLSSSTGFFQQPQQFEVADEKPQLLSPHHQHILINQHQQQNQNNSNSNSSNSAFFVHLPSFAQQDQQTLLPPQPKRHQPSVVDPSFQISKAPFTDSAQELYMRRQQHQQQHQHQLQLLPSHLQQRPLMGTKAKLVGGDGGGPGEEVSHHHNHHQYHHQFHQTQQTQHHHQQTQQQQALIDQLFKAAELVESGNLVHARGILARLNHQLSPVGKPLHRAAFYFKEALLLLSNNNAATVTAATSPPQRISTPFDVFLKIGSYKAFSETSPIVQFANFTCNQVLLEALEGFNSIRIIDFDLGLGGQWASFMQEISLRMGGAPSLRITAITSPSSHDHPLELVLAKDNLSHFASDLGISFAIEILSLDSYDPTSWSLALNVSEGEAIAVNLPASPSSYHPSTFPSILRLVKQLSPKIVVSVERGSDRTDLSFSQHFLHSLNSNAVLLESLDAVSTNPDTVNKIERFLLQPRIDCAVLRRHCVLEKVPPCRTIFATAAFSPFPFSNFTETQAEWLVKRIKVRGFHVEKRQNSLVLCWQMQDLVSVSAWTC